MSPSCDKITMARQLLDQLDQLEKSINTIILNDKESDGFRLKEYQLIREKIITKLFDLLSDH